MKMLKSGAERLSNFELLRIFAMFLIVLHHCNAHGVFSYWNNNSSLLYQINNCLCFFLASGGKIGVTLFVLLTGYFSCVQDFRLKKCLSIYLKTFLYSVVILCLYILVFPAKPTNLAIVSLFPFTHNAYLFITSYLILYTFSPLLNIMLQNASARLIRNYLVWCMVLWVVVPAAGLMRDVKGYSDLFFFVYLYILGGAIRLKYVVFSKKYVSALFAAVFAVSLFLLIKTVGNFGAHISFWRIFKYIELNSVYVFVTSLWLFCLFADWKIKSPLINRISTSMFGVYLLHDNKLVRPFLWHETLKMHSHMTSPWFALWALGLSLAVFAACIVVDKLFSYLCRPLTDYIIKKIPDRLQHSES